jgi:hypothetical protein
MDILVTNQNKSPLLYRNLVGQKNGWIEIKLSGENNRNAVGARITLVAEGLSQIREVNCGNGYQSQSTFLVHFGLNQKKKIDLLEVRWPSGRVHRFRNLTRNQAFEINEQSGRIRKAVPRVSSVQMVQRRAQ